MPPDSYQIQLVKNFEELVDTAKKTAPRQCVVVCADDETVLQGVRLAQELRLISLVLVGNKENIMKCAHKVSLDLENVTVHNAENDTDALQKSIAIVKKHGDFLMKGMLPTSTFLKGVLNREWGLRTGKILSHIAVFEIPKYHKLIFMSDGGMNPRLDLKVRIDIIANALETMRCLGIKQPKIGLIAASETVNPDMPETTDAVKIIELHRSGEIGDCIIEGPFGFDVAVSKEAAAHKKIQSKIAGDVDFLLMPNISAANIWAKGLMYFADTKGAGFVAGSARPVIMLSRADTPETKLNSIALGVALSQHTETTKQ